MLNEPYTPKYITCEICNLEYSAVPGGYFEHSTTSLLHLMHEIANEVNRIGEKIDELVNEPNRRRNASTTPYHNCVTECAKCGRSFGMGFYQIIPHTQYDKSTNLLTRTCTSCGHQWSERPEDDD